MHATDDPTSTLIAMERAALDRWGKGDPSGFLEISAPDVVYFDPFVAGRIDGLEELTRYYEGLRGKIHITGYEIINPKVQVLGDAALLSFNYVSHAGSQVGQRWNCTEAYRREGAVWRIVQTHWSVARARG